MSRTLTLLVLSLAVLIGCTTPPPVQVEEKAPPELIAYTAVQQWLNLQQEAAAMPTETVVSELIELGKPDNVDKLFYFGVLNQELQTFASWTQARDSFRTLRDDSKLTNEQQQLAVILLQYNQNRINWYQRQSELLNRNSQLQLELEQAKQDKQLLQQKIQALTDLEAVISTRKEK